jgi:hypothetical protein
LVVTSICGVFVVILPWHGPAWIVGIVALVAGAADVQMTRSERSHGAVANRLAGATAEIVSGALGS